jgi:hypothetical protein
MLTVLCVRFGNKYSREYVERLRNMVSRHLTIPYEFVCLTDDTVPIEGVKSIVQQSAKYNQGWWHKVHMFDPALLIQGRILYFDLDVIISSSINKLVEGYSTEFLGIRDFNRKFSPTWNTLNSSCLSWIAGTQNDIWDQFQSNRDRALRMHGDQDWIWSIARNRIKFWPDQWLLSYKWEVRNRSEIDMTKRPRRFSEVRSVEIPSECCVTVFHGEPNPHDILDPYVVDNWC